MMPPYPFAIVPLTAANMMVLAGAAPSCVVCHQKVWDTHWGPPHV